MTNISTTISKLEPSLPQLILLVSKIPTDFFLTGKTFTPEIRIPRKESNLKSPAISPPRKDPIPNQYITRIITQQYPNLPPHLVKVPTGYDPFIDDTYF